MQGVAQVPVALQGGYRPGHEFNGVVGVYYDNLIFQGGAFRISPLLQLIASVRAPDAGLLADRPDSGYERLMLSPGIQFTTMATGAPMRTSNSWSISASTATSSLSRRS